MEDYWIQHVRPELMKKCVREIDTIIHTIFQQHTGVNMKTWSEIAKERVRLPIRLKGCGLKKV
jgi:hypothetical protein